MNKDGPNQRAEFTARIEAAKSKMHQAGAPRFKHPLLRFLFSLGLTVVSFTVQSESLHSDEILQGLQKGDQICDEHRGERESKSSPSRDGGFGQVN